MNEDLEAEIARRSREIVEKVSSLTQSHLHPAYLQLKKLAELEEPKTSPHLVLAQQIGEVIDFFKPLEELSKKTQSNRVNRVLLCDSNKKLQVMAKLSLAGTGVDLTVVINVQELESELLQTQFDLILCEAEMKDCISRINSLAAQVPLVVVVGVEMSLYLQTIKDFPHQKYFVSRDVNNRLFTIRNISTTVSKILNKDFFGLEKYLSWGSKVIEKEFFDSSTRLEIIESLKEHFQSFGIRNTILDRVHTVTEEILMNAVYDAPVDANGKALYNHLSRADQVILKPEHRAKLRYGTDGVLLGVSVVDPFGALSKEIITNYLESVYAGHAGELNHGKGGAGRGLHMIVETSDLTIFNVVRGKRTEVIVLFNLDRSQDSQIQPSFHLFLA